MYSIIYTLIFMFAAKAFAAGVTADELVLDLGRPVAGISRVTSAQISEDLVYLKAALTVGYAGPKFTRQLDSVPTTETSSQGFCERLASVFANVRDAHLRAGVDFRLCGTRPEAGRVGANIGGENWLLKTVQHNGAAVDVLAIPKFWPKYDAKWNGFLDAVKTLRAQNRPFVIDLRGNGGGDDSMGFEFARVLLGLDPFLNLPTPVEHRKFRQTPEAFALQSNYWAYTILRLRNEGAAVPPYMMQRRDEILSWMERAKDGQFPTEYTEVLPKPALDRNKIFDGKVIVLVDRGCASACETTLQVLENLPGRVLVGENTFGAVEYGEVGRLVLPHSHVTVALATMNVKFRDGRRIEKSGYAPDVRVSEGADALATALNQIP